MQKAKVEMQKVTGRSLAVFASCILHFALLAQLTGCSARVKADSVPDGPPLAVPIAPAHEIVIEQLAEAPPPDPPPAPEPTPPVSRPTTAKPAAARPEPRAEAPPPAQPPAPAVTASPPAEAPAVRATPAAVSAAEERKVVALLQKAAGDLKRVYYQKLTKEGQAQYDQSKRFSTEAEQAIKERNFVYALTLAEKAATLAAELVR